MSAIPRAHPRSAGLFRPPFAAAQRDPSQKNIERKGAGRRRGAIRWSVASLLRPGRPRFALPGSLSAAARTGGKSPKGRAQDARAFAAAHGRAVSEPPERPRVVAGQESGDRGREGALSLGYFSLGKQREVTRPPGWRTKPHKDVSRSSRSLKSDKEHRRQHPKPIHPNSPLPSQANPKNQPPSANAESRSTPRPRVPR